MIENKKSAIIQLPLKTNFKPQKPKVCLFLPRTILSRRCYNTPKLIVEISPLTPRKEGGVFLLEIKTPKILFLSSEPGQSRRGIKSTPVGDPKKRRGKMRQST